MGLLDDAIREHLELKRRRGADPGEIEREAAEALGPVRRDEPVATAAAEAAPVDQPAGLEDPGLAYAQEPTDDHLQPASDPEVHPGDTPVPDHHDVAPPHGDPLGQATREFSPGELEEALGQHPPRASDPEIAEPPAPSRAPEGEGADGDVLDQTPEFLQETPEHDRLWFEQRPPKDFDF